MPDGTGMSVAADLRLEHDGETIRIRGEDQCLTADSPTMKPYVELSRAAGTRRALFGLLRRFGRLLADNGLSAQICVDGEVIADCGAGVQTRILRFLGLRFVRFRRPGVWMEFFLPGR